MKFIKLSFTLLSVFFSYHLNAQSNYQITGQLVDEKSHEPIIGAVVSLSNVRDTTISTLNAISSAKGVFAIAVKNKGSYKLSTRAVGYLPYERVIAIIGDKQLGELVVQEDVQLLNEVTAYGKIPPSEQKGDTTSFNAKAFKTRADADAEGLLKKMPGMEVSNGSVKAQGEDVQQVLVDGKLFFGNDATLALKSLPAEVIDRIEVFDQQSEQAQFTGFDDGNSKKTINIITNSKVKNSQFGKIYGGYGLEDKYIAGGNINFFNENQRVSLIGLSNNLNIQNFASQDLSGMTASSSRSGGRSRGGRSGGSGDANDFLIGQQNGIIGTNSFGVNYSDKWDKLDLSASYFFNKTSNQATSLTLQNFFASDSSKQLYAENSQAITNDFNHRFNLRGNYKINESQSIIFRPSINFQTNNQAAIISGINSIDGEQVSTTYNDSETNIESFNVSNDLVYRLRLNDTGRTISLGLNTAWSGNQAENILMAATSGRNGTDSLNQLSQINNSGFNYSANVSFTEKIFEKAMLQLNYTVGNQFENAERYTYEDFREDARLDSSLSNISKSDYQTHQIGAGIRFRNEQWNTSVGLDLQYATLSNEKSFPSTSMFEKDFLNLLPNARISYTINEASSLRFNYRTRTSRPTINQLQEVVDNSNPLSLSIGNSQLSQQVDHTFITRYSNIAADKSKTFMAFLYAALSDNYIGNTTFIADQDTTVADGIVLEQGGQLVRAMNYKQSINSRLLLTYGLYIPWLKSNLNMSTTGSYSQVPGEVNGFSNVTENTAIGQGLVLSSNVSNKLDFTLGTKGNYTFSKSSLQSDLNNNYYLHTIDLATFWSFTDKVFWENSLSYQQYFGLSEDLDTPIALWNMGIGVNFLKGNRGQLKLSVYDLLNQNNSISRVVTDAYVEDTQTNILQRYYLLSFTYNLRRFGKS